MREIKFRGKRLKVDVWVFGHLAYDEDDKTHVVDDYLVQSETVGQYIGQLDTNGKEIYEGDIVLSKYSKRHYIVEFKDGGFWFMSTFKEGSMEFPRGESFTVVGNIYDNPELLK
jgi:uncharacterized phage protein (TIGR01671 family)